MHTQCKLTALLTMQCTQPASSTHTAAVIYSTFNNINAATSEGIASHHRRASQMEKDTAPR